MALKIYEYYDKPDELLQPNIEYKFGGISIGIFNGKEIIVSPEAYEKELRWKDAISYCKSLDIDGYKDWYLPSKNELNFIYENSDKMHEIDALVGYYGYYYYYYWSGTKLDSYYAWVQSFGNGYQSSNKNFSYYIRAIRTQ